MAEPNQKPQTDSVQAISLQTVEQSLYEVRQKIYPRSVSGVFARWRIYLILLTQIVYYGFPWLQWNDRQAVLFDLAQRKFYIFGLVLWPQDVIYLTLLLILSALSLFLFTAIAGRLFCGYACPQTVYTEIFLWIEKRTEGDRSARMRRDAAGFSWEKLGRKAAKPGRARAALPTFGRGGLQPGVDLDDTAALLDLMDGDAAPRR